MSLDKNDLLKKFRRGEPLSDSELFKLESTLNAYSNYTTTNSYFGNLPDFEISLIVYGAQMYLYSVQQVIRARKSK